MVSWRPKLSLFRALFNRREKRPFNRAPQHESSQPAFLSPAEFVCFFVLAKNHDWQYYNACLPLPFHCWYIFSSTIQFFVLFFTVSLRPIRRDAQTNIFFFLFVLFSCYVLEPFAGKVYNNNQNEQAPKKEKAKLKDIFSSDFVGTQLIQNSSK